MFLKVNIVGVNDRPILRFGQDRENYAPNTEYLQRNQTYDAKNQSGTAIFPADFVLSDVDSLNLAGATISLVERLDDRDLDFLTVNRSLLQKANVQLTISRVPFTKFSFSGTASIEAYDKVLTNA